MKENIRFKLNGKTVILNVEGDRKLLWVLRTDLGLTGTKYGCGKSLCGACTVVINKEAVRSCHCPVKSVAGKEVFTIEGLAVNGRLHPLQKAFVKHSAVQCGFCTPGMILRSYGFLLKNPKPGRAQIIEHMEQNLCRCGTHTRVVEAIQTAAAELRGGKS